MQAFSSPLVHLLEEVSREDLEACRRAVLDGQKEQALAALERAFAKVDTAIDEARLQALRSS